MFTETFQ